MTGQDKLRETALRLKNEVADEKRLALKKSFAISSEITPEMMEFINENLSVGIADLNLSQSLPMLRIHTDNSSKNQLTDGSDPEIGQLYYTKNKEAYNEVIVSILTVKKARLQNMEYLDKYDATYLVAGVIENTSDPFVMYVKGMSYNKIWELENKIKEYVRPGGVPMFMLKIKISTEKEAVKDGKYKGQKKYVFKLDILENSGLPALEIDMQRCRDLRKSIDGAEKTLNDIIARKGMTEEEYRQQKKQLSPEETVAAITEGEPEAEVTPSTEGSDAADDVPF